MSYSEIQLKYLFFSTDTKLPHGRWGSTCLLKLLLSLSLPSAQAFFCSSRSGKKPTNIYAPWTLPSGTIVTA